jgi:DNA ligase (NAD+)
MSWLLLAVFAATEAAHAGDCPAWTPAQARQELAALSTRVDGWNHAYRIKGQSPVDDAVYDQALQQLAHWRACFPDQAPTLAAHLAAAGGATRTPVEQTVLD